MGPGNARVRDKVSATVRNTIQCTTTNHHVQGNSEHIFKPLPDDYALLRRAALLAVASCYQTSMGEVSGPVTLLPAARMWGAAIDVCSCHLPSSSAPQAAIV